MKDRQFFKNLDTSFIKLDALVRYLHRRSFKGSIHLKFTGYIGEITYTAENKLRVSEHDQIAGRITSGEIAFNNMISRSAEPGGIINVVRSIDVSQKVSLVSVGAAGNGKASEMVNGSSNGHSKIVPHVRIEPRSTEAPRARGLLSQRADFPFDLSNHFEIQAASGSEYVADLELMIDVTSDLLSTIDHALKHAGLDFQAALQKACGDLLNKHPFLDPQQRLFRYSQGFVYISPKTDLAMFAEGLGDALLRIFDRLNASPKFGKVYRFTVQKVRQLMHTRHIEFETAGLLPHVERALNG